MQFRQLRYALMVFAFYLLPSAAQSLPEVKLQIGMYVIRAEVAATPEARAHGLMQRRQLDKNQGMLFIFDHADIHSMWMKNTLLPLSVAFIDKTGIIVNIEEMKPLTETTHSASVPAVYALEMNSGWFAEKGIKAGTKIKGLP